MGLQNDVGLLSEEHDPANQHALGNFPQAFSHIGMLHSIFANLGHAQAGAAMSVTAKASSIGRQAT